MSSERPTDEDLIASIQTRDVRALEEFYDRHRVIAYSLALRMLGSQTDAEDAIQDAFMSVWRAAATYRPDRSSGRSWLLSIVHNRSIDKLRGRQVRPQPARLEEGMDFPDSQDVWKDVADRLTGEVVRRALAELPAEQREAIELAYFQGYTQSQIAQLTEVPLGTVKGRMRIGLHKLRSLLQQSPRGLAID